MAGELVVVYNLLPEIAVQVSKAADKAVRKAAFDVQAVAQSLAPVDTGFLKNSIYTVTRTTSNYGSAQRRSGKKNSDAGLLPEVEHPTEKNTAIVAVGADYGMYVEYGTSHMVPKPYLKPAVEFVWPKFQKSLEEIFAFMEANAL